MKDLNKWIKEINKKSCPLMHNVRLSSSKNDRDTVISYTKSSLEAMECYMGSLGEETKDKLVKLILEAV